MKLEGGQSRRDFLKRLGLGAAAAVAAPQWLSAAETAGKQPTNIIFILADDLGWRDIACNGSTFYETPNIDKLAAQGVRFTNGYAACPVCSPTRASIQTGKFPARLHLTDYIPGARKGKLLPAEYLHQLPLEETTIAEAMKEAGYATCFLGKWHLGSEPYWPDKQGYEVNIGGTQAGAPSSYFSPYKNPRLPDGPQGEYLTDRLTDEAVKFLDANGKKPFLLFFSHYAVHNPQQAKKELVEKYRAKAAKLPLPSGPKFIPEGQRQARQVQDDPVYAAMIQSVDESVGRVMKKLDDMGAADNTMVIFMSDNGGLSTSEGSPTSNVPLRAGKGWLYEGGIREPMIVKWPGVAKPGTVCSEPVVSTDFYPTFLDMAGAPLKPQQHCDGVSLAALLKEGKVPNRKALFWHYPHYGNQGGSPGGAVRCGDYKLIEFYEDNRVELYNLKEDIGEKNDLAVKMLDKAKELRMMLADWRKSVNATMPTPNPDYKPEAPAGEKTKKQQ
ncbi:MAG: sulfatase [Candidatus Sumerlaeota bacterium]|nr:sulfatase [Candidatus Sumerlaeota bacterium]